MNRSRWHAPLVIALCALDPHASVSVQADTVPAARELSKGFDRGASVGAQATRSGLGARFSARITLSQSIVRKDGKPGLRSSDVTYRFESVRDSKAWRTVVDIGMPEPVPFQSLEGPRVMQHPSPLARLEDDGDGTALRFYDRSGRQLAMPDMRARPAHPDNHKLPPYTSSLVTDSTLMAAAPRAAASDTWLDSMLPTLDAAPGRQASFEAQYGRPTRLGSGVERYAVSHGRHTTELTVHPEWQVPLESNTVENGKLITHVRFTYVTSDHGGLAISSIHSETLLPGDSGDRLSVDLTYADVRLLQGASR